MNLWQLLTQCASEDTRARNAAASALLDYVRKAAPGALQTASGPRPRRKDSGQAASGGLAPSASATGSPAMGNALPSSALPSRTLPSSTLASSTAAGNAAPVPVGTKKKGRGHYLPPDLVEDTVMIVTAKLCTDGALIRDRILARRAEHPSEDHEGESIEPAQPSPSVAQADRETELDPLTLSRILGGYIRSMLQNQYVVLRRKLEKDLGYDSHERGSDEASEEARGGAVSAANAAVDVDLLRAHLDDFVTSFPEGAKRDAVVVSLQQLAETCDAALGYGFAARYRPVSALVEEELGATPEQGEADREAARKRVEDRIYRAQSRLREKLHAFVGVRVARSRLAAEDADEVGRAVDLVFLRKAPSKKKSKK